MRWSEFNSSSLWQSELYETQSENLNENSAGWKQINGFLLADHLQNHQLIDLTNNPALTVYVMMGLDVLHY